MAESDGGGPERISLVYDGGLATSGQLHFYEYSRAAYAFARLVATIENFRRTGRVAEKIGSKSYVDIIIRAPDKGSFPIDILIPIAAGIAPELANIPLKDLLEYVIHQVKRLLPRDESTVIQLATIELAREKERTHQSRQETARVRELRMAIESGNLATRRAIDVLETSLKSTDRRIAETGITQADIQRILTELREFEQRETTLGNKQDRFANIDAEKLIKLTSRVRPQLAETGLPLRRSATSMRLAAEDRTRPIASFDADTIDDINSRYIDEEEAAVRLRIFAYDKDTGLGKADILDENLRKVHFSIPSNVRSRLRKKVLRALQEDTVQATIQRFRDQSGTTTSIIILEIVGI